MRPQRHAGWALLAAILFIASPVPAAWALDLADNFSLAGYGDFRVVAPPSETSWLSGGLGKLRYGGTNQARFAEAVGQVDYRPIEDLDVIGVLRAEPQDRDVVDALEAYAFWHPQNDGDLSFSMKAGAFFPTISLENDDLGWSSPYTLTPSAINSWIGEELRTIGDEATIKWHTKDAGTFSLIGAIFCCNDPAGILMADRGWAMDDRPTGLFERVRLPDATMNIFHAPTGKRTGEFDEIDGHMGGYVGLGWQMADIGKLTVLHYDNYADPAAHTVRDTAWETRFWSFGARTQMGPLVLIAQQLSGYTEVVIRGNESDTKFQSAFLLASYDLDDWRFSAREDLFQTRHLAATPSPFSEDGHAFTAAVSWSGYDGLRLMGEVVAMDSRRPEYLNAGLTTIEPQRAQYQLSARFSF
jgi:hypothetical protein